MNRRDAITRQAVIWTCSACGADLGDHATVASGDCVHCGRILCENCYDYDESTAQVTCRDGGCNGQPAAPVYLTLDADDTSLWGLTCDTLHPLVCASFGNPVRDLLPWWDDREPTGIRLLHRAGLNTSWHLVGEARCDCAAVEQPRSKMRPRSWASTLPPKIAP